MAKRDGDDNLSPEMQAKMQAAKKLQDELNAKLSQFGQIASNKNMSSVKEYDDLEKELLELKKYAASVKNENDAKLNDMINAMNKKMEKMAKTALEEQELKVERYIPAIADLKRLQGLVMIVINRFDLSEEAKTKMIQNISNRIQNATLSEFQVKENLKEFRLNLKKIDDPNAGTSPKELISKRASKLLAMLNELFLWSKCDDN
ncbi:uncharacterized protein LOC106670106 isoform X12 [Cimex lectularius]|uniref:Uncharacterized protein n=1 Tax=Cimex lectularius TaxID=79782 RepID=A0A8I6TJI0_CIMLE|nr:uncharacterized protein LOC106670106 isoform X12 [Cimex lectularius]